MVYVRGWSLVVSGFFPLFSFLFLFVSFMVHTTLTNMHSGYWKEEGLCPNMSRMIHAMDHPRDRTNPNTPTP